MLLRLSSSAPRASLVAVAALFAVSLSYLSIRGARAAHFGGQLNAKSLARATSLEPGNPRFWYLRGHVAQYNLEDPDTAQAIHFYRTSLSLDPLSANALLDLGTALESEGDPAAAREAFAGAKRAYPHSAEVAWRFGNFLLRQGDTGAAFQEIHEAVALDPKRGAEAFSRCYRVDPDAQHILDRVLPASSQVYVSVIWDLASAEQTDPALAVWSRLVSLHQKIDLRDSFPLVNLLIRQRQFAEARRVWDEGVRIAEMTPPSDPAGSMIWDGGFETSVNGGGFAWEIIPLIDGVKSGIDRSEKHSGAQALRVAFGGKSNVLFQSDCTLAPVRPGASYLFSAWVKTQTLTSDEGIRFRIQSVGVPGAPFADSPDVHGTEPWTRIEMPWIAAPSAQQARICVLRLQSGLPDNEIQGTAWVDDVALQPQFPRAVGR